MLLELGGGISPHPRADIVIDLLYPLGCSAQNAEVTPWLGADGLPLEDNSVDEVFSAHFMEHIHKGQPMLAVMSEIQRVLKPGGTYTFRVPLIGFTDPVNSSPQSNHIGWHPWADPTHVSAWWFPESLMYFSKSFLTEAGSSYGQAVWQPITECFDPDAATEFLNDHDSGPTANPKSFWSVRWGWEGVACLIK